ncbi:hypothetical protein ELI56_02330 [Rhizobium ruizarguesonis]|uniref:hypothetical protein n=1 Tax=Rhizobium ruizarguesonis TaxID=2081791 RepID=UPI0010305F39|nr:hypothetical protein [Rhizobium ruizarguesonis]TAT77133.1 hypothetical protein ELI56_02330 [Rhizobium ruizarguesonis]
MTPPFFVRINRGPKQSFIARTGNYGLAAAVAVGLLEHEEEKDGVAVVEIWVEALHPEDYPPLFYDVGCDEHGNLTVEHLAGCERRADGSIIMKAYQGRGEFRWFERRDGEWKPLAMWQPGKVATA